VRFGGAGTAAEDIVMLRWRQSMGDTNVADMIEWIESGGVATIAADELEHTLAVVREPGKQPYLAAVAGGQPTNKLADLPRF
jgi:hypothetical protein